jgi:ubiquinone/menaquinone biosynthesis C-methylase UbiE
MEARAYDEMRALEDRHWWFRGRRRVLAPLLRQSLEASGARVALEVGCGTGGNLAHFSARFPGTRFLGVDFDAGAVAYCAERGLAHAVVRADGTRLPVRDASVDCVLAIDIIEHFEDDHALLCELRRVLKPRGELVVNVPHHPWLWSPHDAVLHHKRRYARGELQRKLVAAGFRVERERGFNFLLLPPIALVRLLRARRARSAAARGSNEPAGTDFFELPAPFNAALGALFALEAALVRVLPIREGVSLMLRAVRV